MAIPPGQAAIARQSALLRVAPAVSAPRAAVPPPASPYASLLALASRQASSDIAAQVAAIQAQQAAEEQRARQQYADINAASQAAAQFLTGLGDKTYGLYKNAAQTQAGLASGYSGAVRGVAQSEADKLNAQLAQLGSPQQAINPSASLGDLLYGLGGSIPGTNLLEAGTAAAARENALPAAALGSGQGYALSALGQGRQAAAALTPDIIAAQGKLPSLRSQYFSQLLNARNQQFGQQATLERLRQGNLRLNQQGQNDAVGQWATQQRVAQGASRLKLSQAGQNFDQWAKQQGLDIRWKQLGVSQQRLALAQANATKVNAAGRKVQKVTQRTRDYIANEYNGYFATTSAPSMPLTAQQIVSIAVANGEKVKLNQVQTYMAGVQKGDPKATEKFQSWGIIAQAPVASDKAVTNLYLSLTKAPYNVDGYTAFTLVGRQFPAWKRAHADFYPPKAGAAANGGVRPASYIPGTFNGIDQGVDFQPGRPVRAFASGTVTAITRGFQGGTGHGIYVTLDQPVTWNGRTYSQIYYAEQTPLVRPGQRVNAGDLVMAAGGNEIGFASGNQPVGRYRGRGGLSYSQAGQDFADWLQRGSTV